MSAMNASQLGIQNALLKSMQSAQAAICLPEVQDMLQRLSEYGLGIFMPHMHEEITGQFQPLSEGLIQVESGLKVSFASSEEVANQAGRYFPVRWYWRSGGSALVAACEMSPPSDNDTEGLAQHKMP